MSYRIAQVADLTGVPATAIRYYEDEGLIRPAERAPNGYRVYDDRDVARLRFVSRARNLDLSLADLRDLVELWDDEDCTVVADRMSDQVAGRLRETQQQITELTALAGDLHQVQARLQDGPHTGPCDDQCVCLDRPAPTGDLLPTAAPTHADADRDRIPA